MYKICNEHNFLDNLFISMYFHECIDTASARPLSRIVDARVRVFDDPECTIPCSMKKKSRLGYRCIDSIVGIAFLASSYRSTSSMQFKVSKETRAMRGNEHSPGFL